MAKRNKQELVDSAGRPSERRLDRRDREALREAFAGVTPLDRGSKRRVMSSAPEAPKRAPRASTRAAEPAALLFVERVSDGAVIGRRSKTHDSIVASLARRDLTFDAQCDLHGFTGPEASRETTRFVRERQRHGDRWVLIIVGKGLHSPRGEATLRECVVDTLSAGEAAPYVLALRTAHPRHGGVGAIAVRLVDRI